jgi:hypothetical protein
MYKFLCVFKSATGGNFLVKPTVHFRVHLDLQDVVPMSVPVSVYGYLGLLRSSLGKEMACADIATSSQWMVPN